MVFGSNSCEEPEGYGWKNSWAWGGTLSLHRNESFAEQFVWRREGLRAAGYSSGTNRDRT